MQIKATAGRHFTSTTGASIKEQIRRVAEDAERSERTGLRDRESLGKTARWFLKKLNKKSPAVPALDSHTTELKTCTRMHVHSPPEGGNYQRRTPGPWRSKTRRKRAQPFVERGESRHLPRHGWTSEP